MAPPLPSPKYRVSPRVNSALTMTRTPNTSTPDRSRSRPLDSLYPHAMSAAQTLYLWLTAIFITSLLVANIVGSKFFNFCTITLFGIEIAVEHSVGMFAFPMTFLLTDLLNEYFGARGARRVTLVGLAMSMVAYAFIFAAVVAPPAPAGRTFVDESMFDTVLGASGRMIIASMVAYLAGQFTDIWTFGVMKRLTGGRKIWLRATGSTIISQAVDSLAIMGVLYFFQRLADGTRPDLAFTLTAAAKGYFIKFSIAVAITPLIYAGRWIVRTWFGLEPVPTPARDPHA